MQVGYLCLERRLGTNLTDGKNKVNEATRRGFIRHSRRSLCEVAKRKPALPL